jgi:hypothetical protein
MTMQRTLAALLSLTLATAMGCELVAHIDVCERPRPAATETNVRTDGSQIIDGVQPLVPLAAGGSFLVFTSVSDPLMERTGSSAIRGTLIDPSGVSLRTCDADGEFEYHGDAGLREHHPSVAMPTGQTGFGLIVWQEGLGALLGQFVTQSGCPYPGMPMNATFTIANGQSCTGASGAVMYAAPVVWSLGNNTFQVVWPEYNATGRGTICVRTVTPGSLPALVDFPPNALAPSGAAAPLQPNGGLVVTTRVAPLDGGGFALAWLEATSTLTGQLAFFDAHLARVGAVRTIAPPATLMGAGSDQFGLALAWDGAELYVAYSDIQANGTTDLMVRLFDSAGDPLRTPDSPDGSAVRLTSGPEGIESAVAATPLAQGGALFFYERRATTDDPTARRLYVTALDAAGGHRFLDDACDATAFDIAAGARGRGRLPAATTISSGGVTMAWTIDMSDAADRSGSALRSVGYAPHDLLPIR